MALEELTEFTVKGKAITELQSLRQVVLAGATAATDIAVAGVTIKNTQILSVLEYDRSGGGAGLGTFTDRTSEASITSDGNLQLDTTNTTGSQLLAWLREKPGG